jgi:hypothetical protein
VTPKTGATCAFLLPEFEPFRTYSGLNSPFPQVSASGRCFLTRKHWKASELHKYPKFGISTNMYKGFAR